MYPWGNAYFNITACSTGPGYEKEHDMYCWATTCGVDSPPADCFVESATTTKLCQHGASECALNAVEGCAIMLNPDWTVHMPFVTCAEAGGSTASCATAASIDGAAITACTNNATAMAIVDKYSAYATAKLGKAKLGTPWVMLNGAPALQDPVADLVSAVCKAYTGSPKPAACSGVEKL